MSKPTFFSKPGLKCFKLILLGTCATWTIIHRSVAWSDLFFTTSQNLSGSWWSVKWGCGRHVSRHIFDIYIHIRMIPYDSKWLYMIIWLLYIIIAHFSPLCIRLGLTCDDLKPDFVKLSARAGPPRGTVEFALDATRVKMLTTHVVFTATTLGQNCAMLIHILCRNYRGIRTKTPCRSYQIFSVLSLYYTYQYQYVVFYVVFICFHILSFSFPFVNPW